VEGRGVVAVGMSADGGDLVSWGVPGPMRLGNEVDTVDGHLVHDGGRIGDGAFDVHGEVVVELSGCEGTGGLDEEGAGVAVEGNGVGVGDVGAAGRPIPIAGTRTSRNSRSPLWRE